MDYTSVPGFVPDSTYNANYLINQGYDPDAAQDIVADFQRESGNNPSSNNPNDKGQQSFGLAQWRGPRLEALQQYAQQNGSDINDPDTQLKFFANELHGSENSSGSALQNASDPQSRAAALVSYERPANPNQAIQQNVANSKPIDYSSIPGFVADDHSDNTKTDYSKMPGFVPDGSENDSGPQTTATGAFIAGAANNAAGVLAGVGNLATKGANMIGLPVTPTNYTGTKTLNALDSLIMPADKAAAQNDAYKNEHPDAWEAGHITGQIGNIAAGGNGVMAGLTGASQASGSGASPLGSVLEGTTDMIAPGIQKYAISKPLGYLASKVPNLGAATIGSMLVGRWKPLLADLGVKAAATSAKATEDIPYVRSLLGVKNAEDQLNENSDKEKDE